MPSSNVRTYSRNGQGDSTNGSRKASKSNKFISKSLIRRNNYDNRQTFSRGDNKNDAVMSEELNHELPNPSDE